MPKPQYKVYAITKQDIRRAVEEWRRPISRTKLQDQLLIVAKENGCQYIHWGVLTSLVEEMAADGELEKIKERGGYFRYALQWMVE